MGDMTRAQRTPAVEMPPSARRNWYRPTRGRGHLLTNVLTGRYAAPFAGKS